MVHYYTRQEYEAAAEFIKGQTRHEPRIGLILGSGLNPLAEAVQEADRIPYTEVPGFPQPSVEGHVGRLVVGYLEDRPVMVMQGRVHFYEGYPMQQVVFPVRVMQAGRLSGARHAGHGHRDADRDQRRRGLEPGLSAR